MIGYDRLLTTMMNKGPPMRLMRLSRAAAIGLLLSLTLTACVPHNARRSPTEIAAAQSADDLARQGQFAQAAQAYLALAAQSRGRADSYRLQAAEAWRQEGQIARVGSLVAQIDRTRLSGDQPIRLDLLKAEFALTRHDPTTALRLLTQPNVTVPAELQLRLFELRARAMNDSGDRWGAARTRVQMDDLLSGFDRAQNRQQILDLLTGLGVAPLQQRAAAMQPGDRMLPWVNRTLTQLGVVVAQAQPELGQPVGTLLPGADANVREGYQVPAHVALLLPGDGKFQSAGNSIRQGFFAAYLDAGRNHAPRPTVRVYDSQGTAAGAIAAYQQAVGDGANLVVGPLTRDEVAGVFSQAQLPVPLLALNHPENRKLPTGEVSEFGLLPETEGAQAADHMIERGLQQAYVLISGDEFAHRAAEAFKAELAARGGTVAGTTVLPADTNNYGSLIAALNIASTSTPGGSGIFISMRPKDAQLLVPQLRLARVGLPIFATSHIYGGSDDISANRDLDGVEFCDAPWLFNAQPGLPDRDAIAARLPAAERAGARLFAFGMDAWNLVPYLQWLRSHPGSYVPGATGQLTADQFGRIQRVLIWAKFQNGLAQPLGGSLQMRDVPSSTPPVQAMPTPTPAVAPASSSPLPPSAG